MSIDPNSGAIAGTEPNSGETSFSFSVVATNDSGSATSTTQTVTVVPDASPTTVTVQSVATMTAGQPLLRGGDRRRHARGHVLAHQCPGVALDRSAEWRGLGTEPNDEESSFTYEVTATNASGSATSAVVTVAVTAPAAPTTVTVTGPATVTGGSSYAADRRGGRWTRAHVLSQ